MSQFQGDTASLKVFASERQGTRLLRLRFPKDDGPAGALMLANTLEADEGLARDYVWTVGVLSDSANISPGDVLEKMVTVELVREDGTLRFFNGYVTAFRFVRTDGGFAFYDMRLGPWLTSLRLRHDNAAFHELSGLGITGKVFEQYLRRDWRHRLTAEERPTTYTCQYGESDHNFLHRQWESRGWFYTYEHRADGHTLVLADDSTRTAAPIEGARSDMPFQDHAGSIEDDGVQRWSPAQRICSDRTTLASFNFKHPLPKRVERSAANDSEAGSTAEVYENTGMYGFRDFNDGEALSQLRMEEIEARRTEYAATGNDRTAEPGRWFTLSGHFGAAGGGGAADAAQKYLITSVHHYATNNYQDGSGAASHYSNEMSCIAQNIPWRPGRSFHSFQPRIYGVQTALVVGPAREEIHTDGFGRVKIQFHWDRRGEFDDRSSPWVRVVSSWAGAQFGQISVPRVGMEVVVQFLDGNVNLPLITGCVYNANNMPPWDLPANKTQSGILTRSSREGRAAHANALRFEDKRDAEELWLHAEKDQRFEVENDESHWVGNDRKKMVDRDETVEIKHNRTETVGHDERITVRNNRTETVGKNEDVTIRGVRSERVVLAKEESIGLGKALSIGALYQVSVGGAMNTTVGMSQSTQVAVSKRTSVGSRYSVEAGDEISIAVGAASLSMRSDGSIAMRGTTIRIEASGQVIVNGKSVDLNEGSGSPAATRPAMAMASAAEQPSSGGDSAAGTVDAGAAAGEHGLTGPKERATSPLSPFSAKEQKRINEALDKGEQLLTSKAEALQRWNQDDRDEFFGVFGTDSEQARQVVLKRTNRLIGLAQGMSAADSFIPGTAAGLGLSEAEFSENYAYVDPSSTELKVHTGPMLLKDPVGGKDPAGGIIVHELSHFADDTDCATGETRLHCGTLDGYIDSATHEEAVAADGRVISLYGPAQSRDLAPDQALFHASTYQMYVVNKPVGRLRPK